LKVKVLQNFRDRTENLKLRKTGEVFTAGKIRGEQLVECGLVEIVKEEKQEER
jgi:hypothetical protein